MAGFDHGLLGVTCRLELADGECITMPVQRWHADPDAADELLLEHCAGPTVDVGCGPGRLTAALTARGVPAIGVDVSAVAVRLTEARGAIALRRDVFDRLPGEGRWRHVLLADGNIGIGGDPVALLRRAAELLGTLGTVLVEVEEPGVGLRTGSARMDGSHSWFPWARLGVDALAETAWRAGLHTEWTTSADSRWFAGLRPRAHSAGSTH